MPRKTINTDECILSIDAGTQSIRAALINIKGDIIEIVKTEIVPYYSSQPGWAEQDPEYFWQNLKNTLKKLMQQKQIKKDSIKGVTITTQRNTMINLDINGKPLRPAIIWLDRRKAEKETWPPLPVKGALKALNLYDSAIYAVMECEANWLRQNQLEIWEKTHKYMFLSGFLTYKLTGEFTDSTGNQVGYVPFDFKKQEWAGKHDLKWSMFNIEKEKLPALVRPAEILGYITSKVSRETGVPAGLPVIAAAADKACEVLGSGCTSPEIACLSFGTTATIETTGSKYTEIVPFMPPYPSAIPGFYNTEVMIYRGYWMVSWFKNEFGHNEIEMAKKRKVAPEIILDEMAGNIPAGSMGLMLQPFWSPGVKIPGPEAKGSIIGFGDVHTRAHVYRAILEGLSYALREGAERTEKKNKVKIEKLRVSGGGSQSRTAMQLTADIFNKAAEKPHTYETSALGAAIDAAVGLKLYSDFDSAVRGMTRVGEIFEPDRENSRIYNELYEGVYMKMYSKMKPLYENIRKATKYPPIIE